MGWREYYLFLILLNRNSYAHVALTTVPKLSALPEQAPAIVNRIQSTAHVLRSQNLCHTSTPPLSCTKYVHSVTPPLFSFPSRFVFARVFLREGPVEECVYSALQFMQERAELAILKFKLIKDHTGGRERERERH